MEELLLLPEEADIGNGEELGLMGPLHSCVFTAAHGEEEGYWQQMEEVFCRLAVSLGRPNLLKQVQWNGLLAIYSWVVIVVALELPP